ncbi:MAG: hypothetical protein KGI78_00515 [Patescibacteria group bacterium]|nr:hypothetical protein [Patescibacteria group bacterium]MDE1943975.1 hypothetical protein [Patescibacteria group bacterium]MDE1944696.1 hypothetical protein [Patescibacteria group bacterium]MDE2057321.1 hypothetical protein [Patescibacteria group bacterium]
MGSLIEIYESNITLLIACRHTLEVGKRVGASAFVNFPAPPEPIPGEVLGSPIYDPIEGSDVAFQFVRLPDATQFTRLRLVDRDREVRNETLYSFQHRMDADTGHLSTLCAQHPNVRKAVWGALYKNGEPIKQFPEPDFQRLTALRAEGWLPCWLLRMLSDEGYSGSPIIDDKARLVGMNTGHVTGLQGSVAVCIPTSELYRARRRVHPQITDQLSRLR